MKIRLFIVLLFINYHVKSQINLPIEKSANYRLNQKIKLINEFYDDMIEQNTVHAVDGSDNKKMADSVNEIRDNEIKNLKKRANQYPFPYRALIAGLGNFAASQSGDQISPSANIFATVLPYKSPNFKLNFLFNLGVNTDSSNIDSLKLGTIFFPDKSKLGFGFRISYDFFPWFKNGFKSEIINYNEDTDGYTIRDNIEPFVEYSYNKFNFRKANPDSSNLQTSTLLLGLAYTHSWEKGDNTIGFIITPYYRSVRVTDGTYGLYKRIFAPTIKTDKNPQTVSFLGINTSLQINRFLFSFIYESLKTKDLSDTPLDGGVFTVKATVTGDFLKL